jgi:TolB-like protein/Tfp pilus assembly protein PilF
LERPGEIVTREELKQQLWAADTFVDFDDGLNTAVKKLRDTLGDSAESPRYIETITRRGYRFIGELEEPEALLAGPLEPTQKQNAGTQKIVQHRRRSVRLCFGFASLAAVILGILIGRSSFSTPPAKIQSMAVLPFANLSGDPSQEYFSDAMTDEMTSDLAKIRALRVISRTSAMHYKGTSPTVPQIARELNVDGVIEGSVLRTADKVRITVQLIDARSDRHLWSESYERNLNDILGLQNELAHTIATQVQAVISPAEEERLRPQPVKLAAYEAYLVGRSHLEKWTLDGSREAVRYFQHAIEIDGHYALAYVGIAECYAFGPAELTEKEGLDRARAAATRAVELRPDMGEAHAVLGLVHMNRDWDFANAEAEMKEGIALNPGFGPAHHWYAHLLMYLGRSDEALREARNLVELDPLSPAANLHLGFQYQLTRDWDPAIEQQKKTLFLDPNYVDAHHELGEDYLAKGMYPEAIAELRRATELVRSQPDYPLYAAALGYGLAQAGQTVEAMNILKEIPADRPELVSYIYSGLGDRDRSIALLGEAYRRHTFPLDAGFLVEYEPIRSDPRFDELLHRVHLR